MPNSLKIKRFGIFVLLTFSIHDVITSTARHAATGSVAPFKHERACLNRYSFTEYKLYNIISAMINMDDIFHYFETERFQNVAVQNIDCQGFCYAPTKAPLFEK